MKRAAAPPGKPTVRVKRRVPPKQPLYTEPTGRGSRTRRKYTRPRVKPGITPPSLSKRAKVGQPDQHDRPRARNRTLTSDLTDTTVLIDYRAGSKGLVKYPPFDQCGQLCDIKAANGAPAGDVCFMGWGREGKVMVGVEVKSVDDLVSSVTNGRIQGTQLPVMVDEYDVVWLLVYGRTRAAPTSHCLQTFKQGQWRNCYVGSNPMPSSYLSQFLIGLQEVGINFAQVEDIAQAAAWLADLVRWRTKKWGKHKSLRAFDRSRVVTTGQLERRKDENRAALMPTIDVDTEFKANTALAWPGVGYERAIAAARHFPTVQAMVNASSAEWAEIATTDRTSGKKKRIGPVTADALVQRLTGKDQRKGASKPTGTRAGKRNKHG